MEQKLDSTRGERSKLTSSVAAAVHALRLKHGWSARQLADRCHAAGTPSLTRSTIAKIESEVRLFVTVEELDTFARVFSVPIETLIQREPTAPTRAVLPVASRKGFAGRAAERSQLLEWLASARESRPVTVLIDGEAGIGKTRLIDWFAEEVGRQRALVLKGACIELGEAVIPYCALVEALRLFVRREGLERARRLAGKSWPTLGALIADATDTASHTETGSQTRIFGSVLRLAEQLQERVPLVLIFEDIHWADSSTLDLIRYVAGAATDQRLMLVCSFRSGTAGYPLRPLLGGQDFQRRVHRMSLGPFNMSELGEFVSELSGHSVAESRLRRYFELSEGNAYFAEQLVMADDPDTPEVEIPMSLRELMTARLAQLSENASEVMRIAAVAGRRLDDDLLGSVSDLDEGSLERALRECLGQRILVRKEPYDAYAFQHALLRDTAYLEMLPRTRKRLHARIAQALQAGPGARSRFVPELAYHWLEAGRLPEAFEAAVRAGEQAVRVYAFPEALTQYGRALRLWPDIPDAQARARGPRHHLLGLAADAARWANDVTQALKWVREAIAEVNEDVNPGRVGELQERLGSYLWEAGQYDAATEAYEEGDRLLAGLPPSAVASRVKSALATVANRLGEFDRALEPAQRAVDLARVVGAQVEEGRALKSLGLAQAFSGNADAGEQDLRRAVAIATQFDHLEDALHAYGTLGVFLEYMGRLDHAVTAMREGLAWAKERGLLGTRMDGLLATNAAAALLLLGRYDEAAGLLDSAMLHRPVAESLYARLTRAEIYVLRGGFVEAESLLREIRERSNKDPRFIGALYTCLAEAAAWQGRLDEAREFVRQGRTEIAEAKSVRVVAQLGAVGLRVAADLRDLEAAGELMAFVEKSAAVVPQGFDESGMLVRQCRAENARAAKADTVAAWNEIADGWAKLGQPFRKAYARGRLAAAMVRAGDRANSAAALWDAVSTAEEIGAEPLRRNLEALAHETRTRLGKPRPFNLTGAEMTVLRRLMTGATNAEIAQVLGIAPNTVGVHVSSLLRKMGVRNRAEAAAAARRHDIFPG